MVGIVIVSHSPKIAEGIKELALEMARDYQGLYCAAGLEDGTIGTDAVRIMEAIESADSGDGVVVLGDLGSGIISAETAIDMLDGSVKARIADAPIVEGAIVAAVEASIGSSFERVIEETEKTRGFNKI
ncbi:MAG: PTS-dependent dihydroxyacetone kinase phosphotransferase subunit DhaM [Solobacterium sp.]|nr:PTS-dependent dihydroxyacetone kinase phosphotransferase subunit DhaM [Solobacterium sp.]